MPGTYIPFVDCAAANIQFDLDGIPCEITLGFHKVTAGPPVVGDLMNLATVIQSDLVVPLKGDQTAIVEYRNIHVVDLDSVSGPTYDLPLTDVGTATGGAVPNNVALCVTFLTGARGRSYRGRNYIAGLPLGATASNVEWTTGAAAGIQTIYENFDLALPPINWEHSVLSRFNGGAPRVTGHQQPVIAYRGNTGMVTQRRRLT
jgi:hypothetical protein